MSRTSLRPAGSASGRVQFRTLAPGAGHCGPDRRVFCEYTLKAAARLRRAPWLKVTLLVAMRSPTCLYCPPDASIYLIRPSRAIATIVGVRPLALFDAQRARTIYPLAHQQGARYGEQLQTAAA